MVPNLLKCVALGAGDGQLVGNDVSGDLVAFEGDVESFHDIKDLKIIFNIKSAGAGEAPRGPSLRLGVTSRIDHLDSHRRQHNYRTGIHAHGRQE